MGGDIVKERAGLEKLQALLADIGDDGLDGRIAGHLQLDVQGRFLAAGGGGGGQRGEGQEAGGELHNDEKELESG